MEFRTWISYPDIKPSNNEELRFLSSLTYFQKPSFYFVDLDQFEQAVDAEPGPVLENTQSQIFARAPAQSGLPDFSAFSPGLGSGYRTF